VFACLPIIMLLGGVDAMARFDVSTAIDIDEELPPPESHTRKAPGADLG